MSNIRSLFILGFAAACSHEDLATAGSDTTSDSTDSTETGSDTDSETGTETVDPNDDCVSDMYWMSGNLGSQFMHPGSDCLDCHQNPQEFPLLVLAGTVYKNLHEVDECNGVAGVTVTIADSTGAEFQTTSDSAGNFGLFNVALVPPYTARLDFRGRTRQMVTEQMSTSCNSCHAAEMAPGRIIAP